MIFTARSLLSFAGLLLFVSTSAACAGEATDADAAEGETESSSDAVVAGRATYDRPEIGMVWHGSGLCTGTLVRPNVVLTAMHCTGLGKDLDVSKAHPGFAFEIRTNETTRRRFAVDRLYAFTEGSELDGSQRWRVNDIALLRLTEDVPASLAKPANVATVWPRLGSKVAVYGYGCTDRRAGDNGRRPGTGTKRMKDYTWTLGQLFGWSDTQNVCPGDSGGPLLDTEKNAVIGTTSGYVNGNDEFGNIPASSWRINPVADAWWPRR